jgi:hypothetical protein
MTLEKITISTKNILTTNKILSLLNYDTLKVLKIQSFSGLLADNFVNLHNLLNLKI